MNCKPGDLAVTTGMFVPENNDRIVEVLSLDYVGRHGAVWNVRHRTPMLVDCGARAGRLVTEGQIHDANLRPISGVPVTDDIENEVAA